MRARSQGSIFQKMRLGPAQLRTVANRRFDDAKALRKTGQNARANGAMYLAGFVVECLLKAKLIEKHAWLQHAPKVASLAKPQQRLYDLCYRWHDLAELLDHLPELKQRLLELGRNRSAGSGVIDSLLSVAGQWTIFARYSTRNATIDEAARFIEQVKEVKEWLR